MKMFLPLDDWKKAFNPVNKLLLTLPFLLACSSIQLAQAATSDEEMQMIMEGFGSDDSSQNSNKNSSEADQELKDILQGFEDTTPTPSQNGEEQAPVETKAWDLTTLTSLSTSYNYQHKSPAPGQTDYRGLSRLKLKVQPEFRYQFNKSYDAVVSGSGFYDFAYAINGRDNYTDQVLEIHQSELQVREAYLRGTLTSSIDVTLGRQIVVWGKADSVRVVDVLNPLDFREPGMVDIEDLRLPVAMLKGDYYVGDWNVSAIIIPEIRTNKMPAYGSDFYLGDPTQPAPKEDVPDNFKNQDYALALKGRFQGWDLSFHAAHYYDKQPHLKNFQQLEHARLTMLGVAGNVALGNWMLKAEAAH
ncbi:MAG: DUF1302 family protein, partial [Gammaproteobacteria bacterium]|nr:DUF1302 family protein [Gammaproteobacteria bacterium]